MESSISKFVRINTGGEKVTRDLTGKLLKLITNENRK